MSSIDVIASIAAAVLPGMTANKGYIHHCNSIGRVCACLNLNHHKIVVNIESIESIDIRRIVAGVGHVGPTSP